MPKKRVDARTARCMYREHYKEPLGQCPDEALPHLVFCEHHASSDAMAMAIRQLVRHGREGKR